MQHPELIAADHGRFGVFGRGTGPFGVEGDERVHAVLEALGSGEHVVEQLDGRDASRADRLDQFGGRRVVERGEVGHGRRGNAQAKIGVRRHRSG